MNRRLEIGALQTLCAVQDHGGVTRASEHLALSQSAVSHKLKRLEHSIDCDLLSRPAGGRAGGSALTPEGEGLAAYARRILALHDEALLSLGKQALSGRIRLGMTEDMTSSDLSRILGRFTRLHPNVSVHTHVRQSLTLERELLRGEIDLGVMQVFTHDRHGSDSVLFEDKLHWVKSPDMHLKPDQPLPFLAYDQMCFYRRWAMEAERVPEPGLEAVLECASSAGIASAVRSGLGIALLPGRYVTGEMEVMDDGVPPFLPPAARTLVCCARGSEVTREAGTCLGRGNFTRWQCANARCVATSLRRCRHILSGNPN